MLFQIAGEVLQKLVALRMLSQTNQNKATSGVSGLLQTGCQKIYASLTALALSLRQWLYTFQCHYWSR